MANPRPTPAPAPTPTPVGPSKSLAELESRLLRMGYGVGQVETLTGSTALLVDRDSLRRAVVIRADTPAETIPPTLKQLQSMAPKRPLRALVWGPEPEPLFRHALRRVGVDLALYEPMDPLALRFQLNRALSPPTIPPRRATRAPTSWEVPVRTRWSRLTSRVYSISSRGLFLAASIFPVGRRLWLELPLRMAGLGLDLPRIRGQVVLANHRHDPEYPALPPGVGVAFRGLDAASAAVVDRYVEVQLGRLGA